MSKFNVGDKASIVRGGVVESVITIRHVTPTGRVKIKTPEGLVIREFNPDGWERGDRSSFYRYRLVPWKQEHSDYLERMKIVRMMINEVNWPTLPLEKLREVNRILSE